YCIRGSHLPGIQTCTSPISSSAGKTLNECWPGSKGRAAPTRSVGVGRGFKSLLWHQLYTHACRGLSPSIPDRALLLRFNNLLGQAAGKTQERAYRDDRKKDRKTVERRKRVIVAGSSAQKGEDLQALENPSPSVGLVPNAQQPRRLASGLVGCSNPSSGTKFTLMPAAVYLLRSRTGRYYYGSTTYLAKAPGTTQ